MTDRKIPMVDLQGQFLEIEEEVMTGIREVIMSSAFINGPQVREFGTALEAYTGAKKVAPCGNGTDALQIALMGLELQPGDEVIVPAFTYVATVEVIALLKLKPVFVDVCPDTFNIDTEKLAQAITEKTRAIMVVHLYGQSADMEKVLELAGNIPVIEDNAQALGAEYTFSDGSVKKTGIIGTIGTTSFFPSKNLGCYGDGGAMLTNDEVLGERLRMISTHGQKQKYFHDILGVNSRLDTLQAAILNVKLKHLDEYSRRRNKVADYYDEHLGKLEGIQIPVRNKKSTHVFHQYTLRVLDGKRDDLKSFLAGQGVPSMIYYPLPQHLQKAYLGYGYKEGDFPVSEQLCGEVLSIPIHTQMKSEDQVYICEMILDFYK